MPSNVHINSTLLRILTFFSHFASVNTPHTQNLLRFSMYMELGHIFGL